MRVIAIFSALMSVIQACSAVESERQLVINNTLSACIELTGKKQEHFGNIVVLDTKWNIMSNIGECGCKSAALYYEVKLKKGTVLSQGIISTINKTSSKIVLSSDNSLFKDDQYTLRISCKNS